VRSRASAKSAGASFEKLIADGLALILGDDRIERRTKNGRLDRGDITGVKTIRGGRVILECKDYGGQIHATEWLREAAVEAANDGATVGAVVIKKRGTRAAGEQIVMMTLADFANLIDGGPDNLRGY